VRRRSALRTLALGAVLVGVAAPPLRRRFTIPKGVVSLLAWQAPVALAVARPRTRGRDVLLYVAQMLAYLAHYEMPHDEPEVLLRRTRIDYPIRADRLLGGGVCPTVRLQRSLGRPGEVLPHDTVLSCVHWIWFFVPHAAVAFVLWRRPDRFPRAAALMAATFDAGLLFYWTLPTAPPWWAGRAGALPPVRRLMVEAGERFWGPYWRPLYDLLGGNPFAAMPSIHFATSVMAAHVARDVGRRPAAVGWAYAGALGFALVYLGEHYVVDLAAGLALAEAVRVAEPLAVPAVRAIGDALAALEAGTR
jgi:membrane-associated phospholipid phosphatase